MLNKSYRLAFIRKLKNQQIFVKKQSGRNNNGHITVRHKGGGNKNFSTIIHWSSLLKNNLSLFKEYDAKRTNLLLRGLTFDSNINNAYYYYKILTSENTLLKSEEISLYQKPLYSFEVGDFINNVTKSKSLKSLFARSAGSFAVLLRKQSAIPNYYTIKLPSHKIRVVHRESNAAPGMVSVSHFKTRALTKAGQNRWKGIRPTVRGVAMNPIDHPHGGGQGKTSGGRPSVSPWARLTKGVKTRKNKRTNIFVMSTLNTISNKN